jgi:hypothetical protein
METDQIWTDNSKVISISVIIFWIQIWIRIASDTDTDQIINEYGYKSNIIGYGMRIQI